MFNMEKFIDLFREQLDSVDNLVLTTDTEFRKLEEWSSLVALSVIAMVDEEYNVSLSGDDMRSVSTIGQLFELISKK